MGSFGRTFHGDTPVLTIPPQPAHHPNFDTSVMVSQASTAFDRPTAANPSRLAGRKRSRDDESFNLVEEATESAPSATVAEPEDEWEYGEGMVLIKRSQGGAGTYVTDASNQSGTWIEEKADVEGLHRAAAAASARVAAKERPMFRSHKSQRLDPTSHDIEASPLAHQAPTLVTPTAGNSTTALPSEPVVDHFTLHLGIGWRRISDDDHIQAAARGWARYIENHYPITSVSIRLVSSGLQAYLVEANEGFFLFAEDLKQGRLVSTEAGRALQNLKTSPPVFDSHDTLFAVETPGSVPTGPLGSIAPARVDTDTHMS